MKETVNMEVPVYAPGTILYARQNPTIALTLVSYLQRIYYCRHAGANESEKLLAYFHRELIFPEA